MFLLFDGIGRRCQSGTGFQPVWGKWELRREDRQDACSTLHTPHSPPRSRTARPSSDLGLSANRTVAYHRPRTPAPARPRPPRHQTIQRDFRERRAQARRYRVGDRGGRHAVDCGHGRLHPAGRTRRRFAELPEDLRRWPDRGAVVEFNEILLKACAKDPARRYQSAEEMREELELLQCGRSR